MVGLGRIAMGEVVEMPAQGAGGEGMDVDAPEPAAGKDEEKTLKENVVVGQQQGAAGGGGGKKKKKGKQ